MNRFKSYSGPSKGSATTVCQKCLRKGHYSYECTASSQDRPYVARPSRTQQLLNPKLMPRLSEDVPNSLLQKKGVADEQLAKVAEERARKRRRVDGRSSDRSASVSSESSVSTVSTTLSKSPPPTTKRPRQSPPARAERLAPAEGRPRRSSLSSRSSSDDSVERRQGPSKRRRRRSTTSVSSRGRSITRSSSSSATREPKSRHRRYRSRSTGVDRGHAPRSGRNRPRRISDPSAMDGLHGHQRNGGRPPRRSPSPFSKRQALTQAMNRR